MFILLLIIPTENRFLSELKLKFQQKLFSVGVNNRIINKYELRKSLISINQT